MIGAISFNFINKINKNASIGYWLDKESEGQGIMTNSCILLLDYGFKNLYLHRVEISHAKSNEKSANIIKKLGFTHEGSLRESLNINGEFIDSEYYGLLAEEWNKINF